MANLEEEISRRRTFAIISHPDAGKTTPAGISVGSPFHINVVKKR